MRISPRVLTATILATAAALFGILALAQGLNPAGTPNTAIHHVVVIFDENESFDHYFGTYPNATNPPGEPPFAAAAFTPTPVNLQNPTNLITTNPNSHAPARLDRTAAVTCDQNHNYANEQRAFDSGLMDKFPENTGGGSCTDPGTVMDYYDGNTVTALWNLAQHFTLSDNFFETTFGPSTPGALNLISGDTSGVTPLSVSGETTTGTVIADPDPAGDDCASGSAAMSGTNIGNLMNSAGMTWGWFQGGFRPSAVDGTGKATCATAHQNAAGATITDYSAHHEPFQYYASTRNPHHLPPSSVAAIGTTDQANHQYDLTDFDSEVRAGGLPQVSFLKAAASEDAHPGNSGPVDEQRWIARVLDELQQSPDWASTAVIITYDDSDGWYDHVPSAIVNHSNVGSDAAICNAHGPDLGTAQDRCGYGPRLPMLLISPYARQNTIDHTLLDQASILRFIEDNWNLGRIGNHSFDASAGDMTGLFDFVGAPHATPVYLDPSTGEVIGSPPAGVGSSPGSPATTTSTTSSPPPPPGPTTTAPTTTKPPTQPTKFSPKLSLTTKKTSKTLKISLRVTGLSTKSGKITVSIKLTKGKATIASGHGTVRSGKLTVTLKSKHALKRGTYKLTTTVTQAHKSKKFTKTLRLK